MQPLRLFKACGTEKTFAEAAGKSEVCGPGGHLRLKAAQRILPTGQPARVLSPQPHQPHDGFLVGPVFEVEADEVQARLRRRRHARLMCAVEVHGCFPQRQRRGFRFVCAGSEHA